MRALFSLTVNGVDITRAVEDRMLEIRITDKPGMESDECEIKLDDRESILAIPPKGASMRVALGWEGSALFDFGTYIIDVIRITGGPRTLDFSGKPANLRATAKSQRDIGYESTTLAAIVDRIAARNGWESHCSISANVARVDQLGESDIHFITRLARQYGATATVKDGKLLVLPRQGGKSSSGADLSVVTLHENDVFPGWEIVFPDRGSFAKVKTRSHDSKTGYKTEIEIPNPDAAPGSSGSELTDRHVYSNEAAAEHAAQARLADINRKTTTGTLVMKGRGDINAENSLQLVDFKPGADGVFLIESVTQTYVGGGGWTTSVEISAGNAGKSSVGHKANIPAAASVEQKSTPKTGLVIPDAKSTVGAIK